MSRRWEDLAAVFFWLVLGVMVGVFGACTVLLQR